MGMILAIIGGMLGLDILWLVLSLRLIHHRLWRWGAFLFFGSQLAGLLIITLGRFTPWGRILPQPATAAVYVWHFLGMGIFLVLCVGVLAIMIFRQLWKGFRASNTGPDRLPEKRAPSGQEAITRRQFLGVAAAVAPPLFTFSLTGLGLSQLSEFRIRRYQLAVPGLPPSLNGLTLTQISDIHIGRFTSGRILSRIVEAANELKADLVVLTGDLIDDSLGDLSAGIDLIHQLDPRFGFCMVEGNHDLIQNGKEFEHRVRAAGIPLLLNESALFTVRGTPVEFLGVRWHFSDPSSREAEMAQAVGRVVEQRRPEAFPILLSHHPHSFDAAARSGLPLVLSGHTHGGQLMLNERMGFGPALFRYWSGLYEKGSTRMIVSNGVGNWFPVRINAPAEIVHLTLRSPGS